MAIAVTKIGYYGDPQNGGWSSASDVRVGSWNNGVSRRLVAKYTFQAGSNGATSVTFTAKPASYLEGSSDSSADTIAEIRYVITKSSSASYINYRGNAGTKIKGYITGSYITGNASINLLPGETCYIWVFPGTAVTGAWSIGNCTVTTSGVYGPSSIGASNGYFGDDIPITLTPLVSGVTHDVSASITHAGNTYTDTIATGSSDTSFTWIPDLNTYASRIQNANSVTATITVVTKNGSSTYGSKTQTITVSFKSTDLNPTISNGWVALTADNSAAPAASGRELTIYIQDISKVVAAFDPSKVTYNQTELDSYSITVNGATVSGAGPLTSALLAVSGTIDVVATVKDARGHTASETIQITVYPYYKPRIVEWSIYRSDQNGNPNGSDTYISGVAGLDYPLFDVNDPNNKNSVTLYLAARAQNGSFPTNGDLMTAGDVKTIGGFSAAQSWIGRIRAVDILGNVTDVTDLVPAAVWAIKITQSAGAITGAGIGMAPTASKVLELPSDWNIKVGSDYLFYNAGDSVSGAFAVFGWITSGAVAVVLHVVIPRIIKSGLTFTVSSLTCAVRKDDGGYIGGSENVDLTTSISECLVTQSGLRITLRGSSAWGTNNTPVTGSISLTGAFS